MVTFKRSYGFCSGSLSQLDSMFVNKSHHTQNCSVLPPIADHCPTVLKLQCHGTRQPKPSVHFSWDYQNASLDDLRAALASADWSTILSMSDVNSAVSLWSSTVCSLTQKFVPLKKHSFPPNSKLGYSPLLRKIAHLRNPLFNRSKVCPATSPLVQCYKKVRN